VNYASSAGNSDTVDGLHASSFARIDGQTIKYSASGLPAGWYTIAVNPGNRAVARFGIRDTYSWAHQNVVFYASHMYGEHSEITVLHSSRYVNTPIRYIRIKEGETYDGALLQIYVDTSSNHLEVYLLGDNFQSMGWILKNFVPDGTDPGDVNNFSALTNVAAQVDLDAIIDGGMATTGEIYAGGKTTQYKVWHAGNDGSGSGLDADLLDGYHASSFVKTSDYDDTDVLAKIKNVDGSGSGLDADLLDGYHSSDFILTTGGTITGNLTVEGLLKGILTGHPLKSYSYDGTTVHRYWTKVGQFQSSNAHLAIVVIGKHDLNFPDNSATIVHFSKYRDISYSASVVQFGNVGGLEIKATIDENGGLWVHNPVYWTSDIQFYVLRKYNVDVYTDASIYHEKQPTSWVADPRNSIRLVRQPDGSYIVETYKPHYNFPYNVKIEGNTVWHAGNDGSGSGLDADLLDGKHAGNAPGNIPINNGKLNTTLNADLLDGKHWGDIQNYIDAGLSNKSDIGHQHTLSEISDLPSLFTNAFAITQYDSSSTLPSTGGIFVATYPGIKLTLPPLSPPGTIAIIMADLGGPELITVNYSGVETTINDGEAKIFIAAPSGYWMCVV
jgi:hypothetical protein